MNQSRAKQYKMLGRYEAKRLYPLTGFVACAECSGKATDHHHIDGDTHNNAPENVVFLCRACHLKIEHAAGRLPQQTKLTVEQITAIKDRATNLSAMAREVGLTLRYLQKIRQGKSNPNPAVPKYVPFVAPVDWEYKDLRGKPRALNVEQVKHILSFRPTLGTNTAELLALEYHVNISTIWKARGRQGCYADSIYD